MNDEDFMNIVDDVFEEMNIDIIEDNIIEEMGGESDEEGPLSEDSDCISDCSEDFTQYNEKIINTSQINALNGNTKQCAIYFYYSTGDDYDVCTSCMINLRGVHIDLLSAIRKHVTNYHDEIEGRYCSNCRKPVFLILPCNMCPTCTQ